MWLSLHHAGYGLILLLAISTAGFLVRLVKSDKSGGWVMPRASRQLTELFQLRLRKQDEIAVRVLL
jgi:hypothetical protein